MALELAPNYDSEASATSSQDSFCSCGVTGSSQAKLASFGYRFRGLNEFMKLYILNYTKENRI
jgi:hypothetical protein